MGGKKSKRKNFNKVFFNIIFFTMYSILYILVLHSIKLYIQCVYSETKGIKNNHVRLKSLIKAVMMHCKIPAEFLACEI